MANSPAQLRAADHLVDQLVAQGCSHVFGVPGESYLPVLDALHGREDCIRFVTCRQEGGAAMAADAHARLTGRPGVCMVTRGPGATNASAGIHIAYQDSVPLIVFIGQVARSMVEREAFQEIDYRRMFGQMAKWIVEIDDPNRIQEFVSRAYRTAMAGRPGPVILALPEDMLYDQITAPPPPVRAEVARYLPVPDSLEQVKARLAEASNPLAIVGGGGWTPDAIASLERFAQTQNIPVAASFRCQSLMDNTHPNYVGHFSVARAPYLAEALERADLLLAIGPRMGEITTGGYKMITPPVPAAPLIHVYPAGEELGRVYQPDLALVADMQSFCDAAASWDPIKPQDFAAGTKALRAGFEAFASPASVPGDPLAGHFVHLAEVLPPDAILCNGAGNYAAWLNRFYAYRAPGSQLAPTSGSMGYGLPAAIGAAIAAPDREIFAIAGDGCFMMTCQEMATAAHYGLNLTVIVIDNARYGTIRAHQEREYPGRVSGTGLSNPDFVAFAQSFGAHGARADDLDAFQTAVAQARARGGLNMIVVHQDPKYLGPGVMIP